ncbi:PadR family transcriptional regulator [Actinokineospora pegani]|uniref:PadR family transcriptional regulator n=1 Tax=Actinokineospora pegani TaxID=2654637 RepID=UPI0012EAD600|nr:PadR family transcriptional regulator [Actinokineospora pegani]
MWIEVLLLAKLSGGPLHGYELRKEIERSTGRTLSNNSLYPALRRFVDAAAVTRSAQEQEAKPPRHVYTITDVGRELLHDVLVDFPDEAARNEAEFLARVSNFSRLTAAERTAVVDTRDRALAAELDRLGALVHTQDDPWSRTVLEQVCARLTAEREWVARLRELAADTDQELTRGLP